MKDGRRGFCYQELDALRTIRTSFKGKERTTALAVYMTLTEAANAERHRGGRDGFTASRKQIAQAAGVSDRTIDRYSQEFERLGLVHVERRQEGTTNLPNVWTLTSPPAAGVAKPVRQGGEGAAPGVAKPTAPLYKKERQEGPPEQQEEEGSKVGGEGEEFAMTLDVHVPEVPKRQPKEVDGKLVTLPEHEMADAVLDVFSDMAGSQFTGKEWRAKVVRRSREHPELDARAHVDVVTRNFRAPWWTDTATPSVIYGSAEQFERAMACNGTPRGARQRKSYERDPELLARQARAMVGVRKRRVSEGG